MAVEEVRIFIAVICGDLRCLLAEREGEGGDVVI